MAAPEEESKPEAVLALLVGEVLAAAARGSIRVAVLAPAAVADFPVCQALVEWPFAPVAVSSPGWAEERSLEQAAVSSPGQVARVPVAVQVLEVVAPGCLVWEAPPVQERVVPARDVWVSTPVALKRNSVAGPSAFQEERPVAEPKAGRPCTGAGVGPQLVPTQVVAAPQA